jgi:hypothetical protein
MTAFPFAPALSFRELRERLVSEHGYTFEVMMVRGSRVGVFRRWAGDHTEIRTVAGAEDARMIPPMVVRAVCARPGADPSFF